MREESDLREIAIRCDQITNSPYIRREAPPELKNLRVVLERVGFIVRTDVPALSSEIRRLRAQIKRLQAENEALRANQRPEQMTG
ncbi:MAG: TSC22 domain family protein [Chloroflexota bacterium]|nr:TSC22 domain family protein [Chloroflexota bacterium]MDQ5866194.1 TSC22 domain family protein [Chloroflexota bacterium]